MTQQTNQTNLATTEDPPITDLRAWMQRGLQSHLDWALYFEANPELEKQYVSTGEWATAETHRKWVAVYSEVLKRI